MRQVNKKRMHIGGGIYNQYNHDHYEDTGWGPHDCECHKECSNDPLDWDWCAQLGLGDNLPPETSLTQGGGCYLWNHTGLPYVGPYCGSGSGEHIHEHRHPHEGHDSNNLNNNNNRRNKMARGKRAPAGQRGSRVGRAPARKMARGGRSMARGGVGVGAGTCGGRGQPKCGAGNRSGGYRGGGRMGRPAPIGRTRPQPKRMAGGGRAGVRKMPGGGNIGGYTYGNSGCQMWTGKIDCDAKPGCSWNFDDNCCH